jgi:hypothetical protein
MGFGFEGLPGFGFVGLGLEGLGFPLVLEPLVYSTKKERKRESDDKDPSTSKDSTLLSLLFEFATL